MISGTSAQSPQEQLSIVVMGVAGCGKSYVGETLAHRMGRSFLEGDLLHLPASISKMAGGVPLNDADRWDWLDAVGKRVRQAPAPLVLSCSALRRVYRDKLRTSSGQGLVFAHLMAPPSVILRRMEARSDHFMPSSLLESQFATLEPMANDELSIQVDATDTLDAIIGKIVGSYEEIVLRPTIGAPAS